MFISKLNLLTMETNHKVIAFTRNHSFQWKLFRLVEAVLFNGSHFVYWKIFF